MWQKFFSWPKNSSNILTLTILSYNAVYIISMYSATILLTLLEVLKVLK